MIIQKDVISNDIKPISNFKFEMYCKDIIDCNWSSVLGGQDIASRGRLAFQFELEAIVPKHK